MASIINMVISFIFTAALTAALIAMVDELAENKPVSIGSGFLAALAFMPRLLGVLLLVALPSWVLLFLTAGGSFAAILSSGLGQPGGVTGAILSSLLGPFSLMLIAILLLSLIMGAITVGAERAVVIEKAGLMAAMQRGWFLLTDYLGNFIVLGLILILFSVTGALLIGGIFSVLLAGILSGSFNFLNILITIPITLVIGGFFTIFFSCIWTLVFRFWQGKDDAAPVVSPAPTVSGGMAPPRS